MNPERACAYCAGPITGAGHAGRPWPGRAAVAYCCYGCLSLGEQRQQEAAAPRETGWKLDGLGVRLGIGVLVAAQSMAFGLALNLHDDVPADARWLAQTAILCATLLVLALLGGPLVRAAWGELRRGRLTIEALFLLTLGGAMAASLQAHVTGRGKLYFEVVSVLLVVYTLGKMVLARTRAAALGQSRAWAGQFDTCRRLDPAGRPHVVAVTQVAPGDIIEVYPGETIAVDGVIRAGTGFVSEAAVSGEPFAVVRRPGDRVLAGVASYDATFHITATTRGTARQIDRLLAVVEAARDEPLSLQARADRLGRWFLPLVVLTALGTFGYWTFLTNAGWEAGLFHAMSVLLVACPCVIGLATPIVIWSALSRLAERGLIVRSADTVERLAKVDHVLLDKTGTLTEDHVALLDLITDDEGDERAKLLGWIALVEAQSKHPVARAFAQLPRPLDDATRVLSLTAVPGCGVEAEVEEASGTRHHIRIGRPEWVSPGSRSRQTSDALGSRSRQTSDAPRSLTSSATCWVALDGRVAAVAAVGERVRSSVWEALAEFADLGLPVEVLTGDTAARAAALDLPSARGSLLPDDKQKRVAELKAAGARPLMVGDGINDASALAAAHAGIAISSGTDLAVGASAATLYHGDLRVVSWAVQLSRAAVRSVQHNLYRAVAYNLIGMSLAASAVLHPVVAVLLMTVSSLSLVFSATRFADRADHCGTPARRATTPHRRRRSSGRERSRAAPTLKAGVHSAAVALQGAAVVLLVEAARPLAIALPVVAAFMLGGVALAYMWGRWATVPHWLDMAFGMLTLGNLGMLAGWWADVGFAPLAAACCRCTLEFTPWMWVGMLVGTNVAMLGLGRRPLPRDRTHLAAMFTGGNVGMVAGMAAGGWWASGVPVEVVPLSFMLHLAAMTAGMLAGMLLGTWITQTCMEVVGRLVVLPTWRSHPTRTAG